ncbi:hypothetical protein CALVIDRAFT_454628, partial [Calocera viscosa TUFC12733]
PDMNIIEHCWHYVKSRLRMRRPAPRNADQLFEAAQEEWAAMPREYIQNLYLSMRSRIQFLIQVKGWHTRY